MTMSPLRRTVVGAATGLATIAAGYAAASQMGFDLPRFASNQEVEKVADDLTDLAGEVTTNRELILGQELRGVLSQISQSDQLKATYQLQKPPQPIPSWVIDQRARLEVEVRSLERKLQGLRK